ncbi:hypothetical protein PACTADRAFT_19024 [Pachysolen tannophilus NRRL Y-2460]|uniref:Glycogen debranching enzyme n=1 Tax=Pachysolen tannophilus NRRL Y-2460 TaxID=669874 RepID=A0A1E4TP64_PACTA|nr:hypothetical protein PACTADRAFT_19024 [Pachysolen tannophilus NRRL Y-2460]
MTRTVLLRIDESGEPLLGYSKGINKNGVITLPSIPYLNNDSKSAIFIIKFLIEPGTRISNKGTVWSNFPPNYDTYFDRQTFYKHVIDHTSFDKDYSFDIPIFKPGAYCYYVSYYSIKNDVEGSQALITTRKFYINVPPSLEINKKSLPLNSINLQSMVSKWMGSELSDWNKYFSLVKEKGYNMIHFTPLQHRGQSDSPYSIYDQLKFDPNIFENNDQVKKIISDLEKDYSILSLTDIVWNHTANNSAWLRTHPESGYNRVTAPHLIPAIELDISLQKFSSKMKRYGFPTVITSTSDLLKIMDGIKVHVLGELRLWEFYVLDIDDFSQKLEKNWNDCSDKIQPIADIPTDIKANLGDLARFVVEYCNNGVQYSLNCKRFGNSLDILKFISILKNLYPEKKAYADIKSESLNIISAINLPLYKEYDEDVETILEQLYNRIKYLRLDGNGPKLGEITEESPLTENYFTIFKGPDNEQWELANNGWIWNGNPLVDFASSKSKSYLRREVIIWSDCVKLRYGSCEEDSPYLWSRMMEYTELCASIFCGFRIDNCHSTPLHVGEKLLDVARKVNPQLYVVAELFTGSEEMDKLFVERLAINSLIREAMQAWSVQELSRLLHRHGGRPIGSLKWLPLDEFSYPIGNKSVNDLLEKVPEPNIDKVSEIAIPRVLTATSPHALFMDCTHDNTTPYDKRCVEDTLPTAALVSLCSSATGTVFGYDECFPHLLNVVTEHRSYTTEAHIGISQVKTKLNAIRKEVNQQGTDISDEHEAYVHHEGQYITFHRSNPRTGKGYFLIARTKFTTEEDQWLAPIYLAGTKAKPEFSYSLVKIGEPDESPSKFINPVPTKLETLPEPTVEYDFDKKETKITLPDKFPQGSIAILSTSVLTCNDELDKFVRTGAIEATRLLTLVDLNVLIYRCESEERDASAGRDGVYNVPNYGNLVYAGLQGWISALGNAISDNDLSHPLVEHLRNGYWALDYIVNRLDKYLPSDGVSLFLSWLRSRMIQIKNVPLFLLPRYFSLFVGTAYEACRYRALSLLSPMIRDGTWFVQSLGMTSIQMLGKMRSASLKPFEEVPSLSAGLPHFCYDYMRCWGRDVFISIRGLLIVTQRFDEAKCHILDFASTLKHGLIPNLLGSGKEPRYNARDAAWFFLQAVQDYTDACPNGLSILKEKVKRRFPLDDTHVAVDDPLAFSYETSIEDIIYEILSRHAKGIKYREFNAGSNLDSKMKDEGFNVEVKVDWKTGLIHGGNQWNCGTWMDKMGESSLAGNIGYPGTPRDGAAIEINGLLKSCLKFVNKLYTEGLFSYDTVYTQDGQEILLTKWEQLIQENFERCYYIPEDPAEDHNYDLDEGIINRRGIYKDLYKSGKPYEDYQLRPNFSIAMTVAPELFTPVKALRALQIADKAIRGPVGMKTLDPSDYNYKPYYLNNVDSTDFATAKGRNYHQGPEWVWCFGYFMRAYSKFHIIEHSNRKDVNFIYNLIGKRLEGNRKWLRESPWAGLTELTQKDGAFCNDSSPSQAWSTSCLLDLYHDLRV